MAERKHYPKSTRAAQGRWSARTPEQRRTITLRARMSSVVTAIELHSNEFSDEQRQRILAALDAA